MTEDNFNESNPESSNNQWFPMLRYQKEFEVAGKELPEAVLFLGVL